jgi:membrane-associated protease RseP (regulator of RpoE activity)
MRLRTRSLGSLVVACLAGCLYPHGRTPLLPATPAMAHEAAPKGLYQIMLVEADVPPKMRSGLPWDEKQEEALADPYLEIALNGRVLWKSPTHPNATLTRFDDTPSPNVQLDRNDQVELALWDDDPVGRDPIGMYRGRVFAAGELGDDIPLELEGGTKIRLRLNRPVPMTGTGIADYEVHNDSLVLVKVLPDSPAARAGLAPGDRVVSLDGVGVRKLGRRLAEGKLATATEQAVRLGVTRGGGQREVVLSAGPIWLRGPAGR